MADKTECVLCCQEFGPDCTQFDDTMLCVECADDWGREILGLLPVEGIEERERRQLALFTESER